jgi:hypothetical protein
MIIKHNYDSWGDFVHAAATPEPDLVEQHKHHEADNAQLTADWLGCERAEAWTRANNGWQEGAARIAALPECKIDAARNAKTARVWDYEQGDDGDYERYLMELPFMIRRKKQTGGTGGRIVRVRVHAGENSHVDAEQMLWKTYAALRLIDDLESAGYRCEVTEEMAAQKITRNNDYHCAITVKRADDPVNLPILATAFSPWTLRVLMFSHCSGHIKKCESTYGSSKPLPESDEPGRVIVINKGDCLSKNAAENFLKGIEL